MSFITIFLLSVATFCWMQINSAQGLNCDQLPKIPLPPIQILSANSPFHYDYVLTSQAECATRVWVHPVFGPHNYTGSALDIKGTSAWVVDYTVTSDNKTTYLKKCNDGTTSIWYFHASKFTKTEGSFYCGYSCNGTALHEYKCASNNNVTFREEKEAVDLARKVPNGDKIHWAKANCTQHHGCAAFY